MNSVFEIIGTAVAFIISNVMIYGRTLDRGERFYYEKGVVFFLSNSEKVYGHYINRNR